jgi:polygalacturonase
MISLTDCQRIRVEDVTLTNSPMFHLVPQGCQDVTIDGITIKAPGIGGPNTDGIDPSGFNFHILNCTIDVGDDCIAIKPSRRIDPDQPSCQNFLIENCTFLHGHGMSIGNPTPGGLKNLIVRNCTFNGTDTGIRMKTSRLAGGIVEDCTYENLKIQNVKTAVLITDYYPSIPLHPEDDPAQTAGPNTPIFRNIHISNLTATDITVAGQLIGVAEMPLSNITFDNVTISSKTGMRIIHAKDIKFTNSTITPTTGPSTTQFDADVTGLPE